MSDELKKVYEAEGRLAFYFDSVIPINLYRGQSPTEKKQGKLPIHPNEGFTSTNRETGAVRVRLADVYTFEKPVEEGKAAEGKSEEPKTETWVRGCRATRGDYRGISTFDRANPTLRGFKWFMLPKGVKIPEGLAITQDSAFSDRANHYTIAPKDDMTYSLFLVWLQPLNEALKPA